MAGADDPLTGPGGDRRPLHRIPRRRRRRSGAAAERPPFTAARSRADLKLRGRNAAAPGRRSTEMAYTPRDVPCHSGRSESHAANPRPWELGRCLSPLAAGCSRLHSRNPDAGDPCHHRRAGRSGGHACRAASHAAAPDAQDPDGHCGPRDAACDPHIHPHAGTRSAGIPGRRRTVGPPRRRLLLDGLDRSGSPHRTG